MPAATPQKAPRLWPVLSFATAACVSSIPHASMRPKYTSSRYKSECKTKPYLLHLQVDAIELVKATPGSRGSNALEELAHCLTKCNANRWEPIGISLRIWKDCSVPKLSSIQHSPDHLSSWRPCERSKASRSNVPVRRRESAWAKVSWGVNNTLHCHCFRKVLRMFNFGTCLAKSIWMPFKWRRSVASRNIQEKCAIKKENVWKCRKMWKHVERWKDAFYRILWFLNTAPLWTQSCQSRQDLLGRHHSRDERHPWACHCLQWEARVRSQSPFVENPSVTSVNILVEQLQMRCCYTARLSATCPNMSSPRTVAPICQRCDHKSWAQWSLDVIFSEKLIAGKWRLAHVNWICHFEARNYRCSPGIRSHSTTLHWWWRPAVWTCQESWNLASHRLGKTSTAHSSGLAFVHCACLPSVLRILRKPKSGVWTSTLEIAESIRILGCPNCQLHAWWSPQKLPAACRPHLEGDGTLLTRVVSQLCDPVKFLPGHTSSTAHKRS